MEGRREGGKEAREEREREVKGAGWVGGREGEGRMGREEGGEGVNTGGEGGLLRCKG